MERKWYNSSLRSFREALKTASGEDKKRNLVGVYYTNPYIDKQMLSSPYIEILEEEDNTIRLGIELKPTPLDLQDLENFKEYLDEFNLGTLMKTVEPLSARRVNPAMRSILEGTLLTDLQRYEMVVPMKDPVVEQCSFSINKVSYKQYKLSGNLVNQNMLDYGFSNVDDIQEVYVLLKDATATYENFFSDFVGEDLGKVDTLSILDAISMSNITGMTIGGFDLIREKSGMNTTIWGSAGITLAKLSGEEYGKMYMLNHADSATVIQGNYIKGSTVIREGDTKYRIELSMRDGHTRAVIHLG